MSDPIRNVRELTREGHMNELKILFQEPTRLNWKKDELEQLDELYELALKEDADDPVSWISDFNRCYPCHLSVGAEKTRLSKILTMAKIHINGKDGCNHKIRGCKREF